MTQASLGIQEYVALREAKETKETEDFVALQVDLANPVLMCIQNIFPVSEGQRKSFL